MEYQPENDILDVANESAYPILMPLGAGSERKRLSRACDRCRTRKVKCDLRRPTCANCEIRSLRCEFYLPSLKRGRKKRAECTPHGETNVSTAQHRQSPSTASSLDSIPVSEEVAAARIPHCRSQDVVASISDQYWSPSVDASIHINSPAPVGSIEPGSSQINIIICELERAINKDNFSQNLTSLATNCVDAFFSNLYPIMPLVYRPKMDDAISHINSHASLNDPSLLALLTSLCAVTIAVLPKTVLPTAAELALHFYRASRAVLNTYALEDLEHPTSTSMVIRYFHAEYHHATGRMKSSWHTFGEAIRICQTLRLHDESSYTRMNHTESELCRRIFFLLFVGDKSASILSNHPAVMGNRLTDGGITVLRPQSLGEIDSVVSPEAGIEENHMDLLTGFNFNYDLWRSAYALLLEIELSRERFLSRPHSESPLQYATPADASRLTKLYLNFQTSLDTLPSQLQAHPMSFVSASNFGFKDSAVTDQKLKALAIQRANLQISFQCLRMVVLHAMPALADSMSQLWTATEQNPALTIRIDSKVFESAKEVQLGAGESSALLLQKINIAESMLHIVCSCALDDLRINGEACVAKIRLIGATMLELIDNHPNSPLVRTAQNFRNSYPQILAHLDSKTSDSLQQISR